MNIITLIEHGMNGPIIPGLLDYIKGLLDDAWSPLVTRVQNRTTPVEFEIAVDAEASRPELERTIVRELLERDARFRPTSEEWTRVALDVKRLALEDSTPETMIDYLRRSRVNCVAVSKEPALRSKGVSKGGA